MAKLSIFFLLCSLSVVLANYYYYQNAPPVAGALSYPYVQYGYPYALLAQQPDCDKKEKGESSSSESSSSESSSSESSEEGEKKEKKEEKEGSEEGESKEGGEEKEEGEEKKEGEEKEESSSSSSSSSSEESKEGEGEKKKEKKKEKEEKSLFPPRTYSFPPLQSVYYAPPSYLSSPYKTYSIMQSAPVSYPVKSAYMAAPYAAPVKSYSAPVTRIVSVPAAKSDSGYSTYLSPASGVLSLPPYVGNNVAYYKA